MEYEVVLRREDGRVGLRGRSVQEHSVPTWRLMLMRCYDVMARVDPLLALVATMHGTNSFGSNVVLRSSFSCGHVDDGPPGGVHTSPAFRHLTTSGHFPHDNSTSYMLYLPLYLERCRLPPLAGAGACSTPSPINVGLD